MTEEEIRLFEESNGFIKHNHFRLVEVESGKKAILEVELKEEALNPYGIAHGGLVFSLGDTAMGVTARSTGRKALTLTSSITYLRPSAGNVLRAEAEMIKDGKTTAYLRCNLYDENKKLTASMDASYYYVD